MPAKHVFRGVSLDGLAVSPLSVPSDAHALSDCLEQKDLQMQAFSEAAEGIRTLDLLHGKKNAGDGIAHNFAANTQVLA
jgi:hypothetical protein